jgi:hypothetical protein
MSQEQTPLDGLPDSFTAAGYNGTFAGKIEKL